MTTFVVSLFLPYTVAFESPTWHGTPPRKATTPPPRTGSYVEVATAVATSHEPRKSKETSPRIGPPNRALSPADPTAPTLHLFNPFDRKTLRRTESYVEWGRGRSIFNQPKSRVIVASPSSDATDAFRHKYVGRLSCSAESRNLSSEKDITDHPWTIEPSIQGNGGLTNAIRCATENATWVPILWCGTLGMPTDAVNEEQRSDIETTLANDFEALAVYTEDAVFEGHYNVFCKTVIWPVLNYRIPEVPRSKAYEAGTWQSYIKVNQTFADRIIQSYKHGDKIWVHDYHLMLVPAIIRQQLPDACIGFFLHSAFPSSEIWRCLAARKELLEGMLGANLIAFQTEEYAQHFLQTVSHLLVVEATEEVVIMEDRSVVITHVPIGISEEHLKTALQDPQVNYWINEIQKRHNGKRLIVARDKLDPVRGVYEKIQAYEMFLKENPDMVDDVVFIQVATSSSTASNDKQFEEKLSTIINRVNSQYSTLAHQPIHFLKQDLPFPEYLALMSAADILMLTPLRDGMNLTSHEYVVCQRERHGPLIMSEFSGSAAIFGDDALIVNPYGRRQCADAIKLALEMPNEEKQHRHKNLMAIISHQSGANWASKLDTRLDKAYRGHHQREVRSIPRLDQQQLCDHYVKCSERMFFLDVEGTLFNLVPTSHSVSSSPQKLIITLRDLMDASDQNIVYVTSTSSQQQMGSMFRGLPGLGLIAENGSFVRPFGSEDWIALADPAVSKAWKDSLRTTLDYYKERIGGSYIEERKCSLKFHYPPASGNENPGGDGSKRLAGDLANHVNETSGNIRAHAIPIEGAILFEHMDHSKMTAARWVLAQTQKERLEPGSGSDLIERATRQLRIDTGDEDYGGSVEGDSETSSEVTRGSSRSEIASSSNNTKKETAEDEEPASPECDDGYYSEDFSKMTTPNYSGTPSAPATTSSPLSPQSPSLTGSETVNLRRCTPDFLMIAGNDREDEVIFKWANALAEEGIVTSVFTVCVGNRSNTNAKFTLGQGVPRLISTLQTLAALRG